MITYNELQALKPGDKVGWIEGYGAAVGTVTRVTKTRITATFPPRTLPMHFLRRNGNNVGSGIWSRSYLSTPEEAREIIAEMRFRLARAVVQDFMRAHAGKLTDAALATIGAEMIESLRPNGIDCDRLAKSVQVLKEIAP